MMSGYLSGQGAGPAAAGYGMMGSEAGSSAGSTGGGWPTGAVVAIAVLAALLLAGSLAATMPALRRGTGHRGERPRHGPCLVDHEPSVGAARRGISSVTSVPERHGADETCSRRCSDWRRMMRACRRGVASTSGDWCSGDHVGRSGNRSCFSAIALMATMMLDPDMLSAAMAGLSVNPAGSRTPAAIGIASVL